MPSKDTSRNGSSRLEEALATLIQNQAAFVANQRETDRLHAQFERESTARSARIEAQMAEVIRVLNEHTRTMERLTEAVRDRIGFKPQQ